ncbi:uncharacterized protein LOC129945124 [Eupeodes corollae]|uniref:uncharacterized protein LOC129945124 n=1 Tax=Eupeodes corollae TaxID=290404 RepID=UPI00249169FA|nr:uncharacterized protein LOC129945124 [Eupeodes corollae]
MQKLLRVVAYMTRWLKSHRHRIQEPVIGADELDDALQRLIRIEQAMCFPQDIQQLHKKAPLGSGSPLLSLNPYLDDKDLLRVGGRLTHFSLPHEQKFPLVLPKIGHLVGLLLDHTHEITMHGGAQLMLQTLRHKYWILQGRQAVRTFVHKCVICRRYRGTLIKQQMASLPSQRVNEARPFLSSGVDYCGPFILRVGTKRSRTTTKGYLAIFVCMATKTVHLEVIEDLSSQAFLDAFTRFTGRRGPCPDLYSDNGTAFVGANRLMKEDLALFESHYNQQALAHAGTRWHFITPGAPHQGGLWEAAVKSAKHHLIRLVGSQSLWHHQLHTLAVRIEACLNSRPLVPLHDDPEDKLALTPGDFLIGAPLIAVPEPRIDDIPINHQDFWPGRMFGQSPSLLLLALAHSWLCVVGYPRHGPGTRFSTRLTCGLFGDAAFLDNGLMVAW